MKFQRNIVPAGFDSDEDDYDDYGNYVEKVTSHTIPQEEDFQETLKNACISNTVPEIIRALNSGVNINCYLLNNWTALMHAANNGSTDAVKYLLQNGADPLLDYDCFNVIMCVCKCSYLSNESNLLNCLNLLINIDGVDINSKDRSGNSALMYACSNGLLKVIEFLIDHNADIELKDNQNGETALFFAVRSNHINVVKFLLSRGADKDATDKKNETAYLIAENKNMVDILNLFNANYKNDNLQVYYSEENTYWDAIMTQMQNGFSDDVHAFLENLSMKAYLDTIKSNNISFKQLLSGKKDDFIGMGILLTPHHKLLASALKTFHVMNWSNNCLHIKKNELNSETVAQILATVVRQLHILDASLTYLGTHSYGLNPVKGQEALSILNNIKITEDNIFQLLDKHVRVSQVDYVGPFKVKKIQKKTISTADKMLFATVFVLVLLRVI